LGACPHEKKFQAKKSRLNLQSKLLHAGFTLHGPLFRRGWVGLSQLIWAIVVPIPGHLDVYSRSGGTYPGRNQGRIREGRATEPTDVRTKLPTAGLGSFTDSFTDMD